MIDERIILAQLSDALNHALHETSTHSSLYAAIEAIKITIPVLEPRQDSEVRTMWEGRE